jgi:parvulin-like peptidyl-prolyl isomerase
MTNKKLTLSIISAIIIVAITTVSYNYFYSNSGSGSEKKDSKDTIVATFGNNKSINQGQLETEINKLTIQNPYLKNLNFDNLPLDQKESIIRQIILKEASYEQAKKRNIHKSEEYKKAKRLFERELLQQKLFSIISQEAVSEEKLMQEYEELKLDLKDKSEVRIRYIALKTEKEAKSLYRTLKKYPKSFAKQAKKKSIDESTANNGGDIGFVVEDSLPESVLEQVKKLKKGAISRPFKLTDVNWIIIKLEGKRKAKTPKFADVKERLTRDLGNKAIEEFALKSLDTLDVKILLK